MIPFRGKMSKHFIITFIISLLSCFAFGACSCNKGHASQQDEWSLKVDKTGTDPKQLLQYKFEGDSWGTYVLDTEIESTGVEGEKKAGLLWVISPSGKTGQEPVLELELTSVQRGEIPTGPRWDAPPGIAWELAPSGRTKRFSTVLIYTEISDGLGDPQAYFRRLVPVLPQTEVGKGAEWIVKRTIRLPLMEESGKGHLDAREKIRYRLKEFHESTNTAVITAKLSIEYNGDLEPIGHFLLIEGTGQGKLRASIDIEKGRIQTAELNLKENLNLEVDGDKRKVSSGMTYTLRHKSTEPAE